MNCKQDFIFFEKADEKEIKKEKEKARSLKKKQWWKNKLASGICYYCGRNVGRENLTMDHVVPLIRGGKSTKGNIVAACKECNSKKKYMTPVEWGEYMQKLKGEDG